MNRLLAPLLLFLATGCAADGLVIGWPVASVECSTSTDASVLSQLLNGSAGTNVTNTGYRAQQISLASTTTVTQVDLWLADDGANDDLVVEIQTNNAGSPSNTVASGLTRTINASEIGGTAGLVSFVFATPASLAAGTYHIVMRGVGASASFVPYYNPVGSGGGLEYSSNSGTAWSDFTTGDYYFNVWGCQ